MSLSPITTVHSSVESVHSGDTSVGGSVGPLSSSSRPFSPADEAHFSVATDEDSSIDDGIHLTSVEATQNRTPSRSYKSNEEFLLAMKEDLAEWLNQLYALDLLPDNFMDRLDTGVIICR